jgi:nicotinate-nucleotide adenylyltransferase
LDIALFGGTFDPIHNAHLAVARAARDRLSLFQVLLIPAAVPPHKQNRQPEAWHHRFRMVQLASADEPGLVASDIEADTVRSYSIDTIERVRKLEGADVGIHFLIGADAFSEISTWHRWRDVLASVSFIVVSRPGHAYDIPAGANVIPLQDVDLPVSSSTIREKLARSESPAELPPKVFEYIRRHGLYGFGSRAAR